MTKFTCFTQNRRSILQRKEGFFSRVRTNAPKLSVVIFLALVISGLAYVALINNVSTSGFELKALEDRISVLKEENKKLETEVTKLQSMKTVSDASTAMKLVEVDKVEYLETATPVVAMGE